MQRNDNTTPFSALTKEQILALSNIKGVGPSTILKIGDAIARHGYAVTSDAELVAVAGAKQVTMEALQVAREVAKQQVECAEREGIGLVGYYDDEFPSMLREIVDEDGKHKPPVLLWYRGDLTVTSMPGVAVIGTREPTPEGLSAGKYTAGEFAKRGFNIVSGLAIGCDTCGHEGALFVGGKTTAFLANGLDCKSIYPKENLDLAKRIVASGGLLLSEYPVGQGVSQYALVARDRLQAWLARATVVGADWGERWDDACRHVRRLGGEEVACPEVQGRSTKC